MSTTSPRDLLNATQIVNRSMAIVEREIVMVSAEFFDEEREEE